MSLFGTEVKILSTKKGTFLCLLGIDKMKLKIPKLYYLSELCKQKQKFYKNLFIYLFHAYLLHEWDRAIKQLVLPKLKRKWFFPKECRRKVATKIWYIFFKYRYFFLGIWLSHQIGIFMCGNIRNTNNRCGVNNLHWVLTAHCTYLYVKRGGRAGLSPLNPWLPCVSSCENFPPNVA